MQIHKKSQVYGVCVLEFRRKRRFSSKRKWEKPWREHSYLNHCFLFCLPNLSSSTFCIVCDHCKSYFLPEIGLQGETVWCGNVERSSQRAAKAGTFWEKVMLIKAQSLKLNSAAAPLLFSSFRQPPKMVSRTELTRTNMAWKQIIGVTTLLWSFSKCVCCYYSCNVAAPVRSYISRVQ